MDAILGFFTSKIAGPIFAGLFVVTLIGWGVTAAITSAKVSGLEGDKAKLETSINDPKTGFIAQLSQCRTNVATFGAAVDRQTASLNDLKAQAEAAESRWRMALQLAQKGTTAAQVAAARILALKPTKPVCDSALDLVRSPQ